jgi:hypothetical protein
MNQLKRIPLEYPEVCKEKPELKSKVRELHSQYMGAVMTLEKTTMQLHETTNKQYQDELEKIGAE